MSTKTKPPPPPPPKENCTTTPPLPSFSSVSEERSPAPAARHCRPACCGLETGTGRYTTLSVLLGKERGKEDVGEADAAPFRLPTLSAFEERGEDESWKMRPKREERATESSRWRVGCPCMQSTPDVPLLPPSSSCKSRESGTGARPARERKEERSWRAWASSRARNGVGGGPGAGTGAAMMVGRSPFEEIFSVAFAACRWWERA